MKIKVALLVFVVSFFCSGTTSGQNDFVALTSSQLLKGLNDKEYLEKVLADDGFTLIKTSKIKRGKSVYEYWQYKSLIFIDAIFDPKAENYIIVRVHNSYTDLSERLIMTFPHKSNQELDDHIDHITVSHISKSTPYTLNYSKEGQFIGVEIWYENPFYYFQYTSVK
jgi:hypothetical protein